MSYQVLARKYRPKNFQSLVGQEHVVRALTHALENKRLHHAYLFTGTRGVGKTTLSRILAKSLNCRGDDGNGDITATPCGVCEACTAIDAGRFVDYIEMDAASNRGVDEMAQLLEQAVYAPSNARFKVYMIDEVHMLTNHAFNAMLKTLEEPPEHVKFILATTDPQKIPVTVLSRCLQFNLKQMPPGHIVGHLEHILGEEGIGFETPALRLVAQAAHGSMRDALSLTDQAIAYAAGMVTLEAVQGMLGALDQSYLIRLLDALGTADGPAMIGVADDMAARSLSYANALQDLGTLLHRIALAQTAPAALPADLPEREDVLRLAGVFDPQEVQLFYQIVVHGRNELGLAPDEYAGFSMTLLRMLAFRPESGESSSREALPPPQAAQAQPAAQSAQAAKPASGFVRPAPDASAVPAAAPAVASPPAASLSAARLAVSPARAALEAARARPQGAGASRSQPEATRAVSAVKESTSPAAAMSAAFERPVLEQMPEAAPPENIPPISAFEDGELLPTTSVPGANITTDMATEPAAAMEAGSGDDSWDGNWPALAATLPVRGVAHQLAQQSELISMRTENGRRHCQLRVPLETLLSAGSADKLAGALSAHFGVPVLISTEIGAVRQTAHAEALAEQAVRQRQAEETIYSDPFVQTLVQEFGATIVPGSIRPV
jgi:DNA polymerase-3 subunit gamma/tau